MPNSQISNKKPARMIKKRGRTTSFGVRWQAQRDTALDVSSRSRIQSAVAASLCRRTPKNGALTDKGYAWPNTYAGPGGITWIDRWAITAGKDADFFRGEPLTPAFVMKEAGVTRE